MVTIDLIMSWRPCSAWPRSRVGSLSIFAANESVSVAEFLAHDAIPVKDRVWCGVRLLAADQRPAFAVWCAEQVLSIFEARRPGDNRPRNCIEVTRQFLAGSVSIQEIMDAQDAAVYAASDAAADADPGDLLNTCSVADAAVYAAYAAVYATTNSAETVHVTYAAATAANTAANAADAQLVEIIRILATPLIEADECDPFCPDHDPPSHGCPNCDAILDPDGDIAF